jgi:hypothetical protein
MCYRQTGRVARQARLNPSFALKHNSRNVAYPNDLASLTGLPKEVCNDLLKKYTFTRVVKEMQVDASWIFPWKVAADFSRTNASPVDVALLQDDRGKTPSGWMLPDLRYAVMAEASPGAQVIKCVFNADGARSLHELKGLLDKPRAPQPLAVSAQCVHLIPTDMVYNNVCRYATEMLEHGPRMVDATLLHKAASSWADQLPAIPLYAVFMTWVSGIEWTFVQAPYDPHSKTELFPALECDALELAGSNCRHFVKNRLVIVCKGKATLLLSTAFASVVRAHSLQPSFYRRSIVEWLAQGLERMASSALLQNYLAALPIKSAETERVDQSLSATDLYLQKMKQAALKKRKMKLVEMDIELAHLPPCQQHAISLIGSHDWMNDTRWKSARFFALSAAMRKVDVLTLAGPVLDALWDSSVNKSRLKEYRSQLLNYANSQRTLRQFPCTSMGPPSARSLVGCVYAAYGDARVAQCMAGRVGDIGPHHLATPSIVWNQSTVKAVGKKKARAISLDK